MKRKQTATDEAALIRDCKKGVPGAFEVLYSLYKDSVYSFAYHMTGDPQDAEEITQQAFVRVYRSLGGFRESARLTTWVYRIVANLCIDEQRKKSRLRVVPLDEDAQELVSGDRSDSQTIQGEHGAALAAGLEQLSDENRTAILMKYIGGMSYDDIAATLQCSKGTVGSRISRGLRVLAHELRHLKGHV